MTHTHTLHTMPLGADAIETAPPLPPAIHADEGDVDVVNVGRVHYYADRAAEGRPVLLVHSVNAAASAYEMRPLFEALRGTRPVWALDLPGFGRSSRTADDFTPERYAEAIERVLIDVVGADRDGCDVVALSLSAEFVARAALRTPGLIRRLVLLSPTGLGTRSPGPAVRAIREGVLAPLLRRTPLGRALFELLRAERSIRYFLAKSFEGPIDEGLVAYALRTAAVPDAWRAPAAFLSGVLFTDNARETLYRPLGVPTVIVYDRDPYTDFGALDALTAQNRSITAQRVAPTRGMAHFERTDVVADLVRADPA